MQFFLKTCWTTSDQYVFINISLCHLLSCEFKLWRHRFVHCSNAHDNQSVKCAVSFFFGHKSWVGPQAGICQGVLTHYDEVGVAASPDWGVEAGEHGTGDGGTQRECLAFGIIFKYSGIWRNEIHQSRTLYSLRITPHSANFFHSSNIPEVDQK